jgi:hypothetical protein
MSVDVQSATVTLEPDSQAFVEAVGTPPFLTELGPEKGREVLDQVQTDSLDELRGLPLTLVVNGEAEVLRDGGEANARKLRAAGRRGGKPLRRRDPRLRHARRHARHARREGRHRKLSVRSRGSGARADSTPRAAPRTKPAERIAQPDAIAARCVLIPPDATCDCAMSTNPGPYIPVSCRPLGVAHERQCRAPRRQACAVSAKGARVTALRRSSTS